MQKDHGDGRSASEKACTPLACEVEHCLQNHKYQMVEVCRQKWDKYTQCVEEHKTRAEQLAVSLAQGKTR